MSSGTGASDDSEACHHCGKTATELTASLKRCAKCHETPYCSRDCQKQDWKVHKKICGKPYAIADPFKALDEDTWLHNRPEADVFRLLMDAFCLRVEDDGRYGKFDNDSIYGDGSSVDGYRKFLIAAEQNNRTGLPSWWSEEKRNECIEFGKRGYGESRLNNMLEKHEVIEIYKDPTFPMQLRMLAEKFLLSAPGGMPGGSGAGMRRMMRMAAENGQTASLLSMDG